MTLVAPTAPDDLMDFWEEAVAEALAAPLDCDRSLRNDYETPGFVVEKIAFRGIDAMARHGWFAYPPHARRVPAFLWTPPYGRESKLPDVYGTREGFASLSFNFFGESSFHQEAYLPDRGYFSIGADDPGHWVFRSMFQDAVIALRILQAQVEVDEDRIGAMGMSQGGGMSIWLGAWCPLVRAVVADMPFLCCVADTLSRGVHRYPLKELTDFMEEIPLGRERVLNTVAYYDTAVQAAHCRVPTQVALGLKDPSCRPPNVRAAFEQLPGPRNLVVYDWGHDWHPDMVETNRSWLLQAMV